MRETATFGVLRSWGTDVKAQLVFVEDMDFIVIRRLLVVGICIFVAQRFLGKPKA